MADLDAIYNAYNEITDAKDKASEHVDAYKTIISASQGSDGAKRLAAQFIPTFFKHFPALHSKAIDGIFDLCEDDSSLIRQSAIKTLPLLCKDGPQHTIKIADVLCQLLQLDEQDLVVVQASLQSLMVQSPREVLAVLFRQGVKGADLRERTLDFITHQVMASKTTLFSDPEIELFFLEEMQKAMGSVSNDELETFAKIIMQTKSYATGKLDLTGLLNAYVAHITSEKPFDINDPESVKRVLVVGKLSMPLFKRAISAGSLLEFLATNILPRSAYDRLAEKQKTSLLRLYADSVLTGHPSASAISSACGLLTDLLVAIVPAETESTTPTPFAQVECVTNVMYAFATKDHELVEKEALTPRFRNLYMSTQTQISNLKQALTTAESKKPQDAEQIANIKNLKKTMLIHNNIHSAVKASIPNAKWTPD
ncbi:Apoptosis inhibitor 5 [Gamsiella multidivaricata]|nr:Apoptosis inhibitor 5 [Gamsiella multidivaricata]